MCGLLAKLASLASGGEFILGEHPGLELLEQATAYQRYSGTGYVRKLLSCVVWILHCRTLRRKCVLVKYDAACYLTYLGTVRARVKPNLFLFSTDKFKKS